MSVKSNFYIAKQTDTHIYIVDEDKGGRSVTNDAEAVCAELVAKNGNKRIIYRDSQGEWGELLHNQGVFRGYFTAHDDITEEIEQLLFW